MFDLSTNIRAALIADTSIMAKIANYKNSKAVFTRRPVPEDATYPMIVVSPLVAATNLDSLNCGRNIETYDILVYDTNEDSVNYRNVEEVAFAIARKFHRADKFSISAPTGTKIVNIMANAPLPSPTDDNVKVARFVSVQVQLSY